MRPWLTHLASQGCRFKNLFTTFITVAILAVSATAQTAPEASGEAGLKLPDLSSVTFLGMDGHKLLMIGLLFCVFGLGFAPAEHVRARLTQVLDTVEVVAIIVTVPLALGVFGVYTDLLHKF